MKRFCLFFCFCLFVSCSSRKASDSGPSPSEIPLELRKVFSFGMPTEGLVGEQISWGDPVSQSNPGVDCSLNLESRNARGNQFSCLLRVAEIPYIVRVFETVDSKGQRKLAHVSLDSKGLKVKQRWLKEMKQMGYLPEENPQQKAESVHLSSDKKTRLFLYWDSKTEAITLWLRPASSVMLR